MRCEHNRLLNVGYICSECVREAYDAYDAKLTAQVEALTTELAIARHSREAPISTTVDQVRRETFEATREAIHVLIIDREDRGAALGILLSDIRALTLADIEGGGDK